MLLVSMCICLIFFVFILSENISTISLGTASILRTPMYALLMKKFAHSRNILSCCFANITVIIRGCKHDCNCRNVMCCCSPHHLLLCRISNWHLISVLYFSNSFPTVNNGLERGSQKITWYRLIHSCNYFIFLKLNFGLLTSLWTVNCRTKVVWIEMSTKLFVAKETWKVKVTC